MTILNPFTGETTFEFRGYSATRVLFLFQFRRQGFSTIQMQWERDRWIARLFLLPGRYAFRIEADGVIQTHGVAVIKVDYRDLPETTLRLLALTHTCPCHAHKWN